MTTYERLIKYMNGVHLDIVKRYGTDSPEYKEFSLIYGEFVALINKTKDK